MSIASIAQPIDQTPAKMEVPSRLLLQQIGAAKSIMRMTMEFFEMKVSRKLYGVGCAFALLAMAFPAAAQDKYPDRPVKVVVALPAGGGVDMMRALSASGWPPRWASPSSWITGPALPGA